MGKWDDEMSVDDLPPLIPRLGDEFQFLQNGVMRCLQVIATEWDEQDQEAKITLKPVVGVYITDEQGEVANPDPVIVPDSNPYKKTWHAKDAVEEGMGED